MEGRVAGGGGCCIARYGHNHHGPAANTNNYNPYDGSKIEHIMLRFRPIAPKPVVSQPNTLAHEDLRTKGKRRKSTTNTSTGGRCPKRRKKSCSPSDDDGKTKTLSNGGYKVTTLRLLPETPDLSPRKIVSSPVSQTKSSDATRLCFGSPPSDEDQTGVDEVIGSSVVVEGVTDTWMEGNRNSLGGTNEEKRRRLDEDACPGFISDGWNRVRWTNKAYRKMVGGKEDTWVKVKLQKVELSEVKLLPAFTCRVRVQYGKQSITVPCDAWGLDGGGFAWRLDINAALSLGR